MKKAIKLCWLRFSTNLCSWKRARTRTIFWFESKMLVKTHKHEHLRVEERKCSFFIMESISSKKMGKRERESQGFVYAQLRFVVWRKFGLVWRERLVIPGNLCRVLFLFSFFFERRRRRGKLLFERFRFGISAILNLSTFGRRKICREVSTWFI